MKKDSIYFQVDGRLWGYKQVTRNMIGVTRARNPKTKELRALKRAIDQRVAFKRKVLAAAMEEGWKGDFDGKGFRPCAVALKTHPVRLSVKVYWPKGPRIDWKNCYGLIEDSLFGEDRFVKPGKRSDVIWDTGEPEREEVWIEF